MITPGYSGSRECVAAVRTVPRATPTQHHEAFGHQVDVRVEFKCHGGEEGMQQDQVVALDIPAGLFDLGP